MDFLKLAILLLLAITHVKSDVSSLQDQHQNESVDPLQQQDTNDTQHDQNKRTLCQSFNKCQTQPTSGYVKRLVIKGGYSLRPTGLGYRYPKPKVQFRLKAPGILRPSNQGWKQFSTASKPAIVEVPAPNLRPVDHVHHVGNHIDVQPTFVHPHIDHGVHPTIVPVPAVAPSILAPQAFIPAPAPPVLFEVTKPHLGVLPLGARFNVPPLATQPHPHFHLQPHLQPGLSVEYHGTRNFLQPHQFGAHAHFLHQPEHSVQLSPVQPHNLFLQPQFQQALPHEHHNHYLQPHEHHTQFIQPHLHQTQFIQPHEHHTQFIQPHAHHTQFIQPHEHHTQIIQTQSLPHEHQAHFLHQQAQVLPHEHQVQFLHQQAQSLPHEHQVQFLHQQAQALPHEHQAQFLHQQAQALPHEHQAQFLHQQAQSLPHEHQAQFLPSQPDYHNPYTQSHYPVDVPQYQLPLEGEEAQQVNSANVIQPGQTDVQIPYHLPQHGNGVVGGWQAGEK